MRHYELDVRVMVPYLAHGLHAVKLRHPQVHEHYVRLELSGFAHRLHAVLRLPYDTDVFLPAQHG